MQTTDQFHVKVTRDEFIRVIEGMAFEALREIIPNPRNKMQNGSITIFLESNGKIFITKCIGKIILDFPEKAVVVKASTEVSFDGMTTMNLFITEVLKEKKITQTENLNTPISNPRVRTGNVREASVDDEILSFTFSIVYDTSSDHK